MRNIKKIETLKDLKDILVNIPDKDLEKLGIGTNDEDDGSIKVVVYEEEFGEELESHKEIELIDDWISRILTARDKQSEDEDYSSEGFI